MALENLKENLNRQTELIKELEYFSNYKKVLEETTKKGNNSRVLIDRTIESLTIRLRIINKAIPTILENIKPIPKLLPNKEKEVSKKLVIINHPTPKAERVTINKADMEEYAKEVRISHELLKKLRNREKVKKKVSGGWSFQKPSVYGTLANTFFRNITSKMISKGKFMKLNTRLRKSNSKYIINTYVSIMFFTSILAGIIMILASITGINLGVIELTIGNTLMMTATIILLPLMTYGFLYLNPSLELATIKNRIDQELPFLTLHMSAVAGSGIEPSRIFSIVASSDEYPNSSKELMKIINQINYYGYDLVNALRNVSKTTSSEKLSELLKGLATTISTGGQLTDFLEKRSETLLLDYRLERERYSQTAENFMNIYIAIVITAPMIFMLLLILLGVSGTGSIGFSVTELSIGIILVVAIINVIFLGVLRLKQPSY
ncbi:hypothetical protein COU61_00940 [Candidatus Pacearchaeota archaeon CG10_big_fil_rev_8_21_14_0_10_35_13]|nr:MAG: hypothetical protein COU61_00940 [Candidatus Pacearchaeota archaeon CG10_big_fil_rev_8_21_14_0_10_35_13]